MAFGFFSQMEKAGIDPRTYLQNKNNEKTPSGYTKGNIQQFTPEQMDLFKQMFGQTNPNSFLSKLAGGDQGTFDQMEAPALRQFSELQGNLASRFSGMGGGGNQRGLGARKSSGFKNTMNAAASNFAQDLQSKRQDLQRQAVMDLMGISSSLLHERPSENFLIQKDMEQKNKKKSGWGGIIGAGLGGLGGFFTGGPAGALTGAQFGYGVGSNF